MGRDKDKEKEGKQKRISRSSCSLPADWCITELVPEQQQPTPWPVPLVLLFSITPYVIEYPFGQSGSAVQVLSLPSSLCTFSPLTGGSTRSWNVVNSVQHCSTTTETSLCCQHYSHPKSKTWCHTSHCKENQRYSSQNQDRGIIETKWNMVPYSVVIKTMTTKQINKPPPPSLFYEASTNRKSLPSMRRVRELLELIGTYCKKKCLATFHMKCDSVQLEVDLSWNSLLVRSSWAGEYSFLEDSGFVTAFSLGRKTVMWEQQCGFTCLSINPDKSDSVNKYMSIFFPLLLYYLYKLSIKAKIKQM